MRFHKTAALVAIVLTGGSSLAFAASQGSVGTTSTGSIDISLTIPKLVRIFGLNDIALGSYTGTGTMTGNDTFCVHSNVTSGTYKVKATSANGTGTDFRVKSGSNYIVYDVTFDDDTTEAGSTGLDHDTESAGPYSATKYANVGTATCAGSENAGAWVTFQETALQEAEAGSYTDTLTLLVTPL
jgi:hypothetical protein